jgi:outer membrane protein assembly factor BamB
MRALSRRAALLLPLGAAGCSTFSGLFDNAFDPIKPTLKGTREAVSPVQRGLEIAPGKGGIAPVPPSVPMPDWPQVGGNAAHVPGHPAAAAHIVPVWTASTGEGSGYRQRVTAPPVVAGERVVAMDSDGVVSAFDLATGRRLWRTPTRPPKDRSTNVGGGVAASVSYVWAATGRAEVLAMDAATGKVLWRQPLGAPARSAPTAADGRLYVTTLDDKLLAFDAGTGAPGWSYSGGSLVQTTLLSASSPAVADGFVVAGFSSGDIAAVRVDTGAFVWNDTVASAYAQTSLVDLATVNAAPVVDQGRVFAIGDNGVFVCDDLRSGRRLWERDVSGAQMPWLAGGSLFVVTEEQALAALDARDGQPYWVRALERYHNPAKQTGPVRWAGPLLAGGRLFVVSSDRQFAAFQPGNGALIASVRLPAAVSLPPVTAGGYILVLDDEGTLRAFR